MPAKLGVAVLLTALALPTSEGSAVTLAWPAVAGPRDDAWPAALVVGYRVQVSRDGGPAEVLAEVAGDTTCTLTLPPDASYRFRVVSVGADGRLSAPGAWSAAIAVLADDEAPRVQLGNAPNPFNPQTRISYVVPPDHGLEVRGRLEIHDVRGRLIRQFPFTAMPGEHSVAWDGTNDRGEPQPTGTYLARLVVGDQVATRKMLLTR